MRRVNAFSATKERNCCFEILIPACVLSFIAGLFAAHRRRISNAIVFSLYCSIIILFALTVKALNSLRDYTNEQQGDSP